MDNKDERLQFSTHMEEGRVEQSRSLNEKESVPTSPTVSGSTLVSRPSFPLRGQHEEQTSSSEVLTASKR